MGGQVAPWVVLRLLLRGVAHSVGILSVYFPTHGRQSSAETADEEAEIRRNTYETPLQAAAASSRRPAFPGRQGDG